MVTQVMTAFCNLPGSQSLLTMSQSSGSGHEKSPGPGDSPPLNPNIMEGSTGAGKTKVPLSESVTSLTQSICALTSSIVKQPNKNKNAKNLNDVNCDKIRFDETIKNEKTSEKNDENTTQTQKQADHEDDLPPRTQTELATSVTSLASADLNSTAQDASTISNDSVEGCEENAGQEEAELSESSQSSLSASLSGSNSGPQSGSNEGGGSSQPRHQGPPRPSSLPVPRPHTPRNSS